MLGYPPFLCANEMGGTHGKIVVFCSVTTETPHRPWREQAEAVLVRNRIDVSDAQHQAADAVDLAAGPALRCHFSESWPPLKKGSNGIQSFGSDGIERFACGFGHRSLGRSQHRSGMSGDDGPGD